MKSLLSRALIASIAVAAPMAVATPAFAQAKSIGVADVDGAVARSAAYLAATSQIETTYKPQIDQVRTRSQQLNTELQPLVNAYQAASSAANATQASVQPSYNALAAKQQAAQQEIARLSQPVQLARAYVIEQISAQLDAAVRGAMRARSVDMVVSPQAVLSFQPSANITDAVTAELNRLVPTVQIVPPAGWQPGGQQAAAPAAPATTQPQPQGR